MSWLRCSIAALALLLSACQGLQPRTGNDAHRAEHAATSSPAPASESAPEAAPAPAESAPAPAQFLPVPSLPATRGAEVLAKLRGQLVDTPCDDRAQVKQWQRRYAGSPQRFASQIETILPWLALTLDQLDRYHLPGEFALLPIAESWYRPDARGPGDHVGLWQIGRSTASYLELPITHRYDGRMDALASTDAALRYLAALQNRFGDWRLAAAAYNAGPQRVARLLERAPESSGLPPGLPAGSMEYLARIEALACLLGAPQRHGLDLPEQTRIDPLVAITLPAGQSTLAQIAADREFPAPQLAALNPAFRGGFIAADAPRTLLVPHSAQERFSAFDLPHAPSPAMPTEPAGSTYVVQRGDTLGAIARRHGIALRTLFQLNGLDGRSILRPGQRLRLAH